MCARGVCVWRQVSKRTRASSKLKIRKTASRGKISNLNAAHCNAHQRYYESNVLDLDCRHSWRTIHTHTYNYNSQTHTNACNRLKPHSSTEPYRRTHTRSALEPTFSIRPTSKLCFGEFSFDVFARIASVSDVHFNIALSDIISTIQWSIDASP